MHPIRTSVAVLALALLASTGTRPASADKIPAAPPHRNCSELPPQAQIDARYHELGGEPVTGCFVSQQMLEKGAVVDTFALGQIMYMPKLGPSATMAAIANPGDSKIEFFWGSTHPFAYDEFLIRVYANDRFLYQTTATAAPGNVVNRDSGVAYLDRQGLRGTFTIGIEGCDRSWTGETTCRQGWNSAPITVVI